MRKLILRLVSSEEALIPLILAFCAVNGDLRLFTHYAERACTTSRGATRIIACRFLEHLGAVREPLIALERLSEEVNGGVILREIARSLRLGVEPSEVTERLMEDLLTRLRVKATSADETARAMLETTALFSTIFVFAVAFTALMTGGLQSAILVLPLGLITILSGLFTPSVASLASPRLKLYNIAFGVASVALAVAYTLTLNTLLLAASTLASIPTILLVVKWWRETKTIAETTVALAESMQYGSARLYPDIHTAYAKIQYSGISGLSNVLTEMLRLIPQEGSVTAVKLLRHFAEFTIRYLEIVKSNLVKSIVYEVIVAVTMPLLAMLASTVFTTISSTAHTLSAIHAILPIHTHSTNQLVMLVSIPPLYSLTASKIGRGTLFTPLFPWLAPLIYTLPLLLHL